MCRNSFDILSQINSSYKHEVGINLIVNVTTEFEVLGYMIAVIVFVELTLN